MVVRFLDSINTDALDVTSFFAPDMQWYSISEWSPESGKRHFVSYGYEPARLRSYFQRRIKKHERLHLLEIDVAYEPQRDVGHVSYAIRRTADDLGGANPLVIGKGAIDCGSGKVAVWSMSHDARHQKVPPLCPGRAQPPLTSLACTRA